MTLAIAIFSVYFLNCHYQQYLQAAPYTETPLNTEKVSSFSNCEVKSFNFILNALIWYSKLENNLFLPCSYIIRWLRWSVTLTKNSRSNSQFLSYDRAHSSGSSFFSSRKSRTACFKVLTGNSQGNCTKWKTYKLLGRFTIFFYYDHKNVPLEIIQYAQLGACAMCWLHLPYSSHQQWLRQDLTGEMGTSGSGAFKGRRARYLPQAPLEVLRV